MRSPIDPRLVSTWLGLSIAGVFCLAVAPLFAQTAPDLLEGRAAFGDWRAERGEIGRAHV